MMRNRNFGGLLLSFFGVLGSATCASQPVVGRLITGTEAAINGRSIPARSVVSWPVSLLDEVSTLHEAAVIQLRDGSTVNLKGETTVKIEPAVRAAASKRDGALVVTVVRGSASVSRVQGSSLEVLNTVGASITSVIDHVVPVTPLLAHSAAPVVSAGAAAVAPVAPAVLVARVNASSSAGLPGVFSLDARATTTTPVPTITLPNGTKLILAVQPDGTFKVASIEIPVVTGTSVTSLPVTSGGLVGATISIKTNNASDPKGKDQVNVSFSTVSSTGAVTKINPEEAQTSLDTSAKQAITTAIANNTVPATTQQVTNKPVTTGVFSPAAP